MFFFLVTVLRQTIYLQTKDLFMKTAVVAFNFQILQKVFKSLI